MHVATEATDDRGRAAGLSRSEGRFVVEALVPQPGTYHDGHRISVAHASDERVVINVSALDLVAQTIDTRQVVLASNRLVDIVPIHVRYSWPAELVAGPTTASPTADC